MLEALGISCRVFLFPKKQKNPYLYLYISSLPSYYKIRNVGCKKIRAEDFITFTLSPSEKLTFPMCMSSLVALKTRVLIGNIHGRFMDRP